MYSATSRGFPDIAAQAYSFKFVLDGETYAMTGVSCSAPVRRSILRTLYTISALERPTDHQCIDCGGRDLVAE